MGRKCAFRGCPNRAKPLRKRKPTDKRIHFYTFPVHDPERLKRWLQCVHPDKLCHSDPEILLRNAAYMTLCSEHFSPDDFRPGKGEMFRKLKSTAVPSVCFLNTQDPQSEVPSFFQDTQSEGAYQEPLSDQVNESTDEEGFEEDDENYFADEIRRKHRNPRSCPGEREQLQSKLVLTVTNPSTEASTSASGTYFALPPTWLYQMNDHAGVGLQTMDDVNFNIDCVSNSEEDMAQCSDELVITKVEDFTNDMEMDQIEDYNGRMETDSQKDSGTQTARGLKAMDSSAVKTQTFGKRLEAAELSVVSPVKIKEEPMDEEWRKDPMGNMKDNEDFEQTPDDVKIRATFPVGVNNATIGAPVGVPGKATSIPAETPQPLKRVGLLCTACNKIMFKGQKAFQCSGSSKFYCSTECLYSTKRKTCHSCLKEILDSNRIIIAPVDMFGTVKEFCSQKCRSALGFQCSVCQKTGVSHKHEVNHLGSIHKLCSESCFNQFRSSNKLNMNSCVNCDGYCYGTDAPSLLMEGKVRKFCGQNCLTAFKKRSLKLITCKMCHTLRPAADALDSPNSEGIRELFCSASCVTASEAQTVSSPGVPVECNNCKLKLVPQYHISMFDGSVQNFCSFSCVLAHQTKPNTQVNTVTSTKSSKSTPKPASSESSSSTKTSAPSGKGQSVTKIPCSQCLDLFFHKPKLLEFKRKMYAFCGNTCIEEFRKTNIVMARCENCKAYKCVKVVKRMSKVDRSFCNESCWAEFEINLVKRWGKRHCQKCFYCNSTAKTVVTEVIDGKQEDFCGSDCVLKQGLLTKQEIKCAMCRQAKKMTESVKWLGEMKHFCSLRCLMFFCSLQGVTGAAIKAQKKSLATQCAKPVSSTVPQSTKQGTPVIANVVSLSSASRKQPDFTGNTDPKGCAPASVTVTIAGNKCNAKARVSSFQNLKNKDTQYKSTSKNKATSCKPHTCDAETQIGEAPKVIVLPVPVPVFVPVPMHLYSQYVPQSVGLPVPVPVPLFFPTTLDSAEHIVQTIQEIKEKIPDDPLEADLIMMAEMVAEDAEKEKHNTSASQTGNVMEEIDLEDLSSALSWEEDSVSSAQTPEPERPPPSSSSRSDTLTPVSTAAEEPQMDLEADFSVETIGLLREQMEKDSAKRRSGKRGHDGVPQKKKGRKCASVPPTTSNSLSKLQHEYGVRAWRDWVRWRNAQPNMNTPKFGSHSMTLKEDLLKCCTAELSYGLCKFISEVRRPNGDEYSPDSIFYLCLGIQQYLFENNRMENIFADVFYTKFSYEMSNILKGWKPTILPSGYVHSRVEEEYLWDCKQLGAFSPGVLLNTLLYFFTKHFNYRTAEQHRRLSFAKIRRYSRGPANNKVSFLRFYPQNEDTSTDGVPVKKRKKDERQQVLKIRHNSENPLRCPVKLYEFYLSKCTPGVRQDTTMFYLSPERYCVPSSPTWFSTRALSDEDLDSMIARLLTVRELHLERDETPDHNDSDSDSDFSPF